MVARNRYPRQNKPDGIAKFYAEIKRRETLKRASELREAKDAAGAREAAKESASWHSDVERLQALEDHARAKERRDYFAQLGIIHAAVRDWDDAEKAAAQAEHWGLEVQRLQKALDLP